MSVRTKKYWTKKEEEKLAALFHAGASTEEMIKVTGRSDGAVTTKLANLGLSRKDRNQEQLELKKAAAVRPRPAPVLKNWEGVSLPAISILDGDGEYTLQKNY